jgi:hypothetical protein
MARVRRWQTARIGLLAALCVGFAAMPAAAQNRGPRMATRAELEARIGAIQAELQTDIDGRREDVLEEELQNVAYRLREGDIFEGDVISLAVVGESAWSDDFTVTPQRTIELENVEPISVGNVLYSELEPHLTEQLGRYLREPRVRAEALKRVAVLGAVSNPGFYPVSGSIIVSDLIEEAGGPSGAAQLDKAEFRRLGRRVGFNTGGPIALQAYSLDALGIRSGDELHIPARNPAGGGIWRTMIAITSAAGAIAFALTRIF